jgi:small subunit ribosomal protein S17
MTVTDISITSGGGRLVEEKKTDTGAAPADGAPEPVKKKELAEQIDRVQAKKKMAAKAQKKRVVTLKETGAKEDTKGAARARAPRKKKVVKDKGEGGLLRDIGVEITPPGEVCQDHHCPFHGNLPVRGQTFDVVVVSSRMQSTAVVQRQLTRKHPKYERQLKITHRYLAHNPGCIAARPGETVRIMECRPISKKKSFTIIGRL